ncbi:putative polygalacturonate 4-alpha-galacturonosyltransferase [Lupinus albus]|uniref:Hexosyltransferase n=1 Tax=Lupinus albus TaxID=3870 RepID=A0A6A4NXF9_LUPAL|nr:putative polygalacturonate 4-alpha-galacturonosyltransferase [Lupinus albus]
MLWIMKFSRFFSFAMFMIILSPSLQSFHPAEAIRSSPLLINTKNNRFSFRKSSPFRNSDQCNSIPISVDQNSSVCNPFLVHIVITLHFEYLRGSIAAVNSILQRSLCPSSIFFHFIISNAKNQNLESLVESTFPELKFKVYSFNPEIVKNLISTSLRQALEQPLNYARNYLAEILEDCVHRVIYLDSDLVVIDDISKLWSYNLDSRVIGVPEYCHANFSNYFTTSFWSNSRFAGTFKGRRPCYFNTRNYTKRIEKWMEIQKSDRIYELGSLPPFLLVFAGRVASIEHRWNQHGLGGDNVRGSCRDLDPGPVSLLHWSGSGKPWIRLDSNWPCPLDSLWAHYDLYGHSYS